MENIKIIVTNSKARFNYFLSDFLECGIELQGTEIKSLRKGNANINDSYARIKNGEVYLTNMYIGKYEEGNIFNHDERRERKLLLHKKEISDSEDDFRSALRPFWFQSASLSLRCKSNN